MKKELTDSQQRRLRKILSDSKPNERGRCGECGLKRSTANVFPGKKLPYPQSGKCIRPEGFCEPFTSRNTN
jgi:hypothetical protein